LNCDRIFRAKRQLIP